jgi:Na+/H+ antiporter NhaD/arsenite permease-like protein
MLPACVALLGVLALLARERRAEVPRPLERGLLVAMIRQQADVMPVDRRLLVPPAAWFAALIAGLTLTGWFPFPPELIALGCAALCVWSIPRPAYWLTRVDVQSALFISCLFIFAGAIQATGSLDDAATFVVRATEGNPYALSAAVIGLACVLTAFFSAGPTTAALIPAAEALRDRLPGHVIWWCLSLGVLAGSSATLLSATAGPVAANIVKSRTGVDLTFGDFLRLGWQAALSFSALGILYVWLRLWSGI